MTTDPSASTEPPSSVEPPAPRRSVPRRIVFWVTVPVIVLVLLGIWGWCVLAINFSNLPGQTLRTIAAGLFGVGWIAAFALLPQRMRTMLWFLGAFVVVLVWWWFIPASNDRDWQPEFARMPHVEVEGDRVTVHNIRNCDYRTETDFDVHYYDKTLDLKDLQTMDFVCSSWGVKDIVHTLLTFGFRGGEHVVLSVVPRREKDEPHASALGSIFKRYELIYILADEYDVLRLRTNFRKENVYVFPGTATPEQVRVLFRAVIDAVNDLCQHPRYYNLSLLQISSGGRRGQGPTAPRVIQRRACRSLYTYRYPIRRTTRRKGLAVYGIRRWSLSIGC